MEISQVIEDREPEAMEKLIQKAKDPLPSNSCIIPQEEYTIQEIKPGPPHEALFLVLAYLPLFELLAMGEVCMSLRDAVHKDVLPWLNIIVERPLNLRLTDEILKNIASKAIGRLKTLALMNCVKITDDGLQSVIDRNHGINKLYIPTCTGLTSGGVIRAVKTLSEHNHSLKSLRINGIYNIEKEELEILRSYLQMNLSQQMQQPMLFHHRNLSMFSNKSEPLIDVDICPKCKDVRMVYDCPREACKRKNKKLMHPTAGCKGCNLCIPRCEECGGCLESEEIEETACGDSLCSECWLKLPKCNFCNRPYCNQHTHRQCKHSSSSDFVCDVCHERYVWNFT
ncbi:hypothetical protein F2P56_035390 [Juglans regia]|uniref:F-box domain-containing protein n=2 Tax=Juglans regia TaxID=51240 RepID=A0A833TJD3_JUGRE|nr:F-box protein SKIP28 [Juglans regia]KAF5442767.1 hypothetical protein F2P56_035390 [Juglans regia]